MTPPDSSLRRFLRESFLKSKDRFTTGFECITPAFAAKSSLLLEAECDEELDAVIVDCDDFEALGVFSGFFISLMFRMEGNKVDMFLEWEDVLSFPDIVFQLDTSLLGVLVCSGGVSGSDNLDPVRVGDLHENSAAFGFLGRYRPDDTLPLLLLLDRCDEC